MAYTKAPMENTHNVIRVPVRTSPFLVSSFSDVSTTSASVPVTARFVNCFPVSETQWGTDPLRRAHKREGWTSSVMTGTVTSTGDSGICTVQSYTLPNMYTARGGNLYRTGILTETVTAIGTFMTRPEYGYGTNAIDQTNARRIAWLESAGTTTILTTVLEDSSSQTTTDVSAQGLDGSKGLVFINGYLFASDASGTKIYNSDPAGNISTWNTTNFLDAEQYADKIVWLDKHKNYLVAFGQASIEFFFDASIEVGSPLKRQESYSTRIGLLQQPPFFHPGSFICNQEDDLYFLGFSEQQQIGLYRIKNFQVEKLGNEYVESTLNSPNIAPAKMFVCQFNNQPHVVIFYQNQAHVLVYSIDENTWWFISGSDFPSLSSIMGRPFNNFNSSFFSLNPTMPRCFIPVHSGTTQRLAYADNNFSTSVTAQYRTEIIDMGINRWKHLARIDAIGDFNTNSLSLSFVFNPTYPGSTVTAQPNTQQASVIGYENNISWYNLGATRRFNLQFTMAGNEFGILEAFDIEYNIGVA